MQLYARLADHPLLVGTTPELRLARQNPLQPADTGPGDTGLPGHAAENGASQDVVEAFEVFVKFGLELAQAFRAVDGHVRELDRVLAELLPALGRDEIAGRVGVSAARLEPGIAGA